MHGFAGTRRTTADIENRSLGLDDTTVEARRLECGLNVFESRLEDDNWAFLKYINMLSWLILLCAVVSLVMFILNFPTDSPDGVAFVFLTCLVITTAYDASQEDFKAQELLKKYQSIAPDFARVLRNGHINSIPVSDLVMGDLIYVTAGDKIPADCRVVFAEAIEVDQSPVNGKTAVVEVSVQASTKFVDSLTQNVRKAYESKLQAATPSKVIKSLSMMGIDSIPVGSASLHDQMKSKNVIFRSSLIVGGKGLCVVIRTGTFCVVNFNY